MTNKEQFLIEHNKLSPLSLQATLVLLTRFRTDKTSLFKDENWSIDKLRRPFILWLTSLPSELSEDGIKQGKDKLAKKLFHPYPVTKV
ncbi:MAG: hypothetical protein A2904_00705 [Candidatus Staskawiczbacteria bacterium RIFCSPLOWO2_01_FULL_33_9]|uniref:Uncharacterized protein n=1 Tax=Candidatus Staskawiczbacteria bacterium RIFCSPLOWO2_01_FULL_33_9 TaxID=1802211 RepID=A0A1G2I853_9BACT|nr:MAG: hypothetical protein A2904_00705 [Candidatus Staskawiczbacteria bacterium RIFCSPLOWO2_01_FULL_33_9]